MRITIWPIPHDDQRYDTCGDWQWYPKLDELAITVSRTGDWREEVLVGLHEAVEAILCIHRGISQDLVDSFDIEFEKGRAADPARGEPGDQPDAPYYKEHQFATDIEKLIADQLGVDWQQYNDHLDAAADHDPLAPPKLSAPLLGDPGDEDRMS